MPVCKKCKNYVLTIPCPHCGSGEEFHARESDEIKQIVPLSVQAVTRNAPAPTRKSTTHNVIERYSSVAEAYKELNPKEHYSMRKTQNTNLPKNKPKKKSSNLSNEYDFKQNYNNEKIEEFEKQIINMNSSIKTLNSLVKTLIKNNNAIIKVISSDYIKPEE